MKPNKGSSASSSPPPMTVSDEAESSSLTIDGTIVVVVGKDDKFRSSLCAVQRILKYTFRNISLLEAALTHSSFSDSPSYQRLEFVGDACLNLAFANFVFLAYPNLDPGQLSVIRAANISTEKFARTAVRHDLFSFVRHNAPHLQLKVKEFALAIEEEDETLPYGGSVKAPKVLADIVESVAAALYVDCNFDCKLLWEHFSPILEPIITLENMQHQPVTMLYELCQKEGKNLDFKHWRNGAKNICSVYVNGKLLSSASSEQKDISKLSAAKEALQKISRSESKLTKETQYGSEISNGEVEMHTLVEIQEAKQKLIQYCQKRHWPKPTYSVDKVKGPSHDRRFICSVQIETSEGIYKIAGDTRSKVKDAENSAASALLHVLKDSKDPVQLP